MSKSLVYQKVKEAIDTIRSRAAINPQVGLILGSGLGSIGDHIQGAVSIPYSEVPHFHTPSVQGHAGKVVLGHIKNVPVVVLQGRFHFYEGHSMDSVSFPARVLCALGIHSLVVTNAAGGVNTRFRPGDLMLIEDHLNLMGDNPLKGANLDQFGPRFPDLTEAYSQEHREIFKKAAAELEISVQTGVYAGLQGPTYETPAEVRMLRALGADAVGMSTVPETIVANHMGVRVAGISCITNLAAGLSPHKLSHQEVIDESKAAADKMLRLLMTAVPRLSPPQKGEK